MVVAMVGCEEEGRRCQREELYGEHTAGGTNTTEAARFVTFVGTLEVAKITQRRFLCGGSLLFPRLLSPFSCVMR